MKSIHKTILRLKLSLGMLILLLKGNDVKGQDLEIYNMRCYRPIFSKFNINIKADISISHGYNLEMEKATPFSAQIGQNSGEVTFGAKYDYFNNSSFAGGYFRYFVFDQSRNGHPSHQSPFTVFLEPSVMFPVFQSDKHGYMSFSYGVILKNIHLGGIELFHSLQTNHTLPKGYLNVIGLRLHYYYRYRRMAIPKDWDEE